MNYSTWLSLKFQCKIPQRLCWFTRSCKTSRWRAHLEPQRKRSLNTLQVSSRDLCEKILHLWWLFVRSLSWFNGFFLQIPVWKMDPTCLPVWTRVLEISRTKPLWTAPSLPSPIFTTWSSKIWPPNLCGNLPVSPIPLSQDLQWTNRKLRRFQVRTTSRWRQNWPTRREDPQPLSP